MRILVVDDSQDSRDITEAALASAGFDDVSTAESGWDAFKFLELGGQPPDALPLADIVLLDVVMPEIDGIEVCTRIRSDPRYADTPIIMVTSVADMECLGQAFVAGASDYVTKPVNRVELLARVRAALKLKSELERRQARERELLVFVSTWGERRAKLWMDSVTGLFVGEVAESYLTAAGGGETNDLISIVVLQVDRLDAYRAGQGEQVSRSILARVGHAVRAAAAAVGSVAAAYHDGMIVLVLPEYSAGMAAELAESLHAAVATLANSESIATDHVTASVAAITGRVGPGIDRAHLLTQAIFTVKDLAAAGGNRVLGVSV
jgi:phosphoserine phosphatase RsbU/P